MKPTDPIRPTQWVPSRIRTFMVANVVVAIVMVLFLNFKSEFLTGAEFLVGVARVVLILAVLGTMIAGPLIVVEVYLYRMKKGVFFQWTAASPPPPRDIIARPRISRYPRPAAEDLVPDTRVRTRLFESDSATDTVSRAALLLTVGNKLAVEGKKKAAERCYRQILERFADTPEALEASRLLESATHGGDFIARS
jgi:hypothetical protein